MKTLFTAALLTFAKAIELGWAGDQDYDYADGIVCTNAACTRGYNFNFNYYAIDEAAREAYAPAYTDDFQRLYR